MSKEHAESLRDFANSPMWDEFRDEFLKDYINKYMDVSIPFKYGDIQLEGADAFYAKVGATTALQDMIHTINRYKKSPSKSQRDFG